MAGTEIEWDRIRTWMDAEKVAAELLHVEGEHEKEDDADVHYFSSSAQAVLGDIIYKLSCTGRNNDEELAKVFALPISGIATYGPHAEMYLRKTEAPLTAAGIVSVIVTRLGFH